MKKLVLTKELFSSRKEMPKSLLDQIGKPGDIVIITSFVPEDHESIGILLINNAPVENDEIYESMTSRVLINGVPRIINNCFIFPIDIDA